jgi:hypothetical protein
MCFRGDVEVILVKRLEVGRGEGSFFTALGRGPAAGDRQADGQRPEGWHDLALAHVGCRLYVKGTPV